MADEHFKAVDEFRMKWATYRDGQQSMLNAIVCYLEMNGYQSAAAKVKEKFSGHRKNDKPEDLRNPAVRASRF